MKFNLLSPRRAALAVLFLPLLSLPFFTGTVSAQKTGAPNTTAIANPEQQGQLLVQKILAQWPITNTTNTGRLKIRDGQDNHFEYSLVCQTLVTAADWRTFYEARGTNGTFQLLVIHSLDRPNAYFYRTNVTDSVPVLGDLPVLGHLFRDQSVSGPALVAGFAGSDFSPDDLGLEFLHWPQQKALKNVTHRSRGCTILESTNPNPIPGGYSRVTSWIDDETLGIVEACAYDANGKLLKDFYPKKFRKVNGQYQVETLIMENSQADSRSEIDFDFND
jgi:hypothetical protein